MYEKFSFKSENYESDMNQPPRLSNLAEKKYLEKMCASVGLSIHDFLKNYPPDSTKKDDREIYCNFIIGAAMLEFNHFYRDKKYDDCLLLSKKIKEFYVANYFDLDVDFRRDIEEKFKRMNEFFDQLSSIEQAQTDTEWDD